MLDEVIGRKYLLGELSLDDQHRVEELAFLEPPSFELLRELENELIDDYISHDLTASERHHFESYFLSSASRRQDLRIAKALQAYTQRNQKATPSSIFEPIPVFRESWLWRWLPPKLHVPAPLWGALAVLMLIAAILLGVRLLRTSKSTGPIQANREVTTNQRPDRDTEAVRSTPTPNSNEKPRGDRVTSPGSDNVVSFLLVPGSPTRGDDNITKIPLPDRSSLLRFDLPLIEEIDYPHYQVTLQQAELGNNLRRWTGLQSQKGASGKLVHVMFRSQLLRGPKRYRFVLTGVAADTTPHTIAYYYFITAD